MLHPRIYRAALLPAVAAFVLMMFSLEPIPNPLREPVSTPEFDGREAARTARQIAARAPERAPGSEGDRTIAGLVRDRFAKIEGGQVSTQEFSSSYRGDDVELENVILTIPGDSERALLIVAARDSAEGLGAASSAAATAELLSLADDLGAQRHRLTIVLASTDAGAAGYLGARELVDGLGGGDVVEAALALSQPGVEEPAPPFAIGSATEPDSPAPELIETARAITSEMFEQRDEGPGTWVGLSRLAVPVGLGEGAALRAAGVEAITLSAAGERPLDPARDNAVSSDTLRSSGGAALDLALTLDGARPPLQEGPSDFLRLGDNLIPGWTVALLALALLLAPLLSAADTWLSSQREDWRARRTIPWALERALPPLAALLLAYGLAIVGLIPDPPFPYDPGAFPPGARGPIAFVALAAAFALVALLIRPMRTPLDSEPHTLAAAAGLVSGVALLGIWALNPFLALLLAPAAHVWVPAARVGGPPRAVVMAALGSLSLVGAVAAFATVAIELDLGLAAPWHLLLLVDDGGIGLMISLLWCLLLGGLIAAVSATAAEQRPATIPAGGRLRGAGSHVGPGALGSTPGVESRHR